MENKVKNVLSGIGFYGTLAVCLLVVGVCGWVLLQDREDPLPQQAVTPQVPVSQPVEMPEVRLPTVETLEPAPMPVPPKETKELPEVEVDHTPVAAEAPRLVVAPLRGDVLTAFSMEELVYSPTLGDWRTHNGVDIAAQQGTTVLAASAGAVLSVTDDPLMGTTVVLEHDNGYQTTYANLQAKPNVEAGDPVSAGQIIGAVGTTAAAESGQPHLHFAVTKDGKAVVRNTPDLSDLQTAVGGDAILVQDGKIVVSSSEYGDIRYSRTAVGVKADGTIMTFVTYGRRAPISYGRTYYELAQMMQRGGCVAALALDGGGSSTFCSRPEGTDKLEVRNTPTDGAEREVSSSLLVVSTTQATGVFDHAVLSPNNEVYTPGTQVQFSAVGVDTAGKSVALPEGVSYALSEGCENMGTMDAATGLLTTNEACGTLGVDMLLDGKVVGTTTIEVATPDQIYFANEEISLGFEETTDFGLVVRSQGRDIHIKSGDILWSITDVKTASGEAAAAEDMGTFDGNSFTSSDGKTLNGNVNAVSKWDESVKGSIHAIVGMLPTVVWDFEDHVDAETGAVTPASDYYVGDSGILTTRNYGRGGKQSIEIVSIDDDEPVRFGSKALKLNYDFRDCGAVTEGACIGTTTGMQISGTPTAIGAWVYAPEGVGITYDPSVSSQAGFWLRGYVKDGAGNNMAYDFTLEPKSCVKEDGSWNGVQPGIYWEGWQYVEADLTKLTPPYSIQPGMTFRLMYVVGQYIQVPQDPPFHYGW